MAQTFNTTPIQARLELALNRDPARIAEAAARWGISVESVKRYLNHLRQTYEDLAEAGLAAPPDVSAAGARRGAYLPEELGDFATAWDAICALTGRPKSKPVPAPPAPLSHRHRRIVAISDLHGRPLLEQFVELTEALSPPGDPAHLAIVGDLSNAGTFGPFMNTDDRTYVSEEATLHAVIEFAASRYAHVFCALGNHDLWIRNKVMAALQREGVPVADIERICDTLPLLGLAAGYPNVSFVHNEYDYVSGAGTRLAGQFDDYHILHLGDALLGHPNLARKNALASVKAFSEWVHGWSAVLDFPCQEPRLIAMGHTHRAGYTLGRGGHQVLAELGMAGQPSTMNPYTVQKGKGNPEPPALAALLFEQTLQEVECDDGEVTARWTTMLERDAVRLWQM